MWGIETALLYSAIGALFFKPRIYGLVAVF